MNFASQITRGSLDSNTTLSIASGQDIEVLGFIISNNGANNAAVVDVEEADGTTFMKVELNTGHSYVMNIPFLAHKGIQFDPVSAVNGLDVTVFHTSPGGGVIAHGETAPKYTYGTLDSTVTIESGAPIKVFGFGVHNASASDNVDVVMRTGDGDATALGKFDIDLTKQNDMNVQFMADKGLEFTSSVADADITVTVFHSNPGL